MPFPVLIDKGGKVSAPYSAGNVDMVLVGKDGAVRAAGKIGRDVPRFRSVVKAMP